MLEKCNFIIYYFIFIYDIFLGLVTAEFHPFCPFWLKLFSAFILTYFIIELMICFIFLISNLFSQSTSNCKNAYW